MLDDCKAWILFGAIGSTLLREGACNMIFTGSLSTFVSWVFMPRTLLFLGCIGDLHVQNSQVSIYPRSGKNCRSSREEINFQGLRPSVTCGLLPSVNKVSYPNFDLKGSETSRGGACSTGSGSF